MRFLWPAICAAMIASPAFAQKDYNPQAVVPPTATQTKNIVPAAAASNLAMAEWDDNGMIRIAMGDEAAKAPAGASHYDQRAFNWSTGSLRVLHFKKSAGAVLHQITYETEIYVLEGSVDVEVAGKPVTLKAGDAASLPTGAVRNKKPMSDVTVLAFTVGTTSKDAKAMVVRGADVKAVPAASWIANGKSVTTSKPEEMKAAPKTAARWATKRYEFDGNSIRVAAFAKSGTSGDGLSQTDALLYIAKGKLGRTEGPESAVMQAGDAVRETSGLTGHWDGLEQSVFIATSAPFPKGIAPTKPQ